MRKQARERRFEIAKWVENKGATTLSAMDPVAESGQMCKDSLDNDSCDSNWGFSEPGGAELRAPQAQAFHRWQG